MTLRLPNFKDMPKGYLTPAQADELFKRSKAAKRSKYFAQKTPVDGIVFASKKEARRYEQLRQLLAAREIAELVLQPVFPIVIDGQPLKIRSEGFPGGRAVKYIGDFQYLDLRKNVRVVEDTKGLDTPTARLKRALVEHLYGIRIAMIGGETRRKRRKA